MPRPETTAFSEAVYARLAPIATQDEQLDWPLLRYIVGLAQMFAKVEALARSSDGRVPYSPMMDVNTCPPFALPFLAQFVGVRLRPLNTGETLDTWAGYARDAIRRRGGRRRGTRDAMDSAIQETLTGTRTVRFVERDGDPYNLTVITRPGETPNAAAALAAALTQKPAGILLTMIQSDLPLISEGTRTINAAAGTIDTATLANIT